MNILAKCTEKFTTSWSLSHSRQQVRNCRVGFHRSVNSERRNEILKIKTKLGTNKSKRCREILTIEKNIAASARIILTK